MSFLKKNKIKFVYQDKSAIKKKLSADVTHDDKYKDKTVSEIYNS